MLVSVVARTGVDEQASKRAKVRERVGRITDTQTQLVASVVFGLPFYKRNLERMGEKAQGKR